MADSYETKLVISADTSDAEKKLKDVGNTKVPSVKVDVAAEKVKIDAPKVGPVKVPVEVVQPDPIEPKVETPTVTAKVETPVVEPVVKTPEPVKATVIEPQPIEPKVVQPDPIEPKVETPTVTAKVETPVVEPVVKTPEPVKATVIEPQPVTPKVVQPKPVEITVGIKDEEAKRRLAEITALHEIPCKPVGFSEKDGEKFRVEFQPDDTKVVNALREVTSQEHVVIVGMRAKYQDALRLHKELSTPVEKPVKVVEKREPAPAVVHKDEPVRVTERRDAPKAVKATVIEPQPVTPKVVQPKPVTVDVKANPDPLEPKVKKPDPINVQAKFDETGVGRFVKTLHGVREVASRVMSALGLVGFVAGTVMAAVAAFQALKTKIEEVQTRVARLKFATEMQAATSETNRLCATHERLARVLKEELDTLSKQKAVRAIKEQGAQDAEDGRRAADRARQIYAAKTPEEEQSLRDRFAEEDEQIERSRRRKTRDTQIRDLDEEESSYTSKAKGLRQNNADIDRQIKDEELNVRRARGSRKDGEEVGENEKAAAARLKALKERKAANEAEIAQYEKEAAFRREQIAALQSVQEADTAPGQSAASVAAAQRAKEKARDNDRATTDADRDWRERRQREAERKGVEDAVEAQRNPGDKAVILDAQAHNARAAAADLQRQYDAEMAKDAGSRDADKLAELRTRIDDLESTADSYTQRSKDIKIDEKTDQADKLEAYASRIASVEGVSQNRLTAMGLGSGVTNKSDTTRHLNRIVDLLREEIRAIKENKPSDTPAATFSV